MKHIGEKFLSNDDLQKMSRVWSAASSSERNRVGYFMKRKEAHRTGQFPELQYRGTIDVLHGASFIKQIIPKMIAGKKTGEKVSILDIGGGTSEYARQLRTMFGEKVSVFTTGLTKKYAKERLQSKSGLLTRDDLKWRSVLQLSNYPEFDLILDTFGEQHYHDYQNREAVLRYFHAIAAKLRKGGIASIAPFRVAQNLHEGLFEEIQDMHHVSITVSHVVNKDIGNHDVLRIEKPIT